MIVKHKIILAFVLLILISGSFPGISGQTPPRNATGYTRYIDVYQGDSPDTEDIIEGPSILTVMDWMEYNIPWNVTRIYIHIPEGADVKYFFDHNLNGSYGISEYPNWYYWDFPSGINRNYTGKLVHNSSADFVNGTFISSLVNTTDDVIKLQNGIDKGDFTSIPISVTSGVNVGGVKVSVNTTHPSNVTIQVSNDNGTTWLSCLNDTFTEFTTQGTLLRYRLNITGSTLARPVIDEISVELNVTPASNTILIMAVYTFTSDRDPPEFSMTKELLYGINPAEIRVYTEEDYAHDITGSDNIEWLGHWDTTEYETPGKTLAGVGTIEIGETFTLSLRRADVDSGIDPVIIVYVVTIILVIVGLFFIYKGYKDREKELADDEEPDDEETDNEEEEEDKEDEGQMEEESRDALLDRKEKTLKAIKRLDNDFEEGVLSEDVYLELKDKYKNEAIKIMKELDK